MYNVKFFKYPSGWQVRVYSALVGIKDNSDDHYFHRPDPGEDVMQPIWYTELQDYIYEPVMSYKTWLNPFTDEFEKPPIEYEELMKTTEEKKNHSLRSSMGRTVNAIYRIARANEWDWFITLTFNPEKVDSLDYSATVSKLSKWLNNCKTACPDMGYLVVPEKHESGRFHFHGLFKACDSLGFIPSGHKDKKGNLIYNIGKYKLGWSTATKVNDQSRVTKYIAKYINKDLCQVAFGKKRYWASRNLDEPEVCEVILDREKLQMLTGRLNESASHIKLIETGEFTATIYELPKEACNETF